MMRRSPRTGSTLVEAAIVLVLFLVILIGIMDVGQMMYFHQGLTERVRAGARYAALHTYDPGVIKNVVSYNSTIAPQGGGGGLFGIDPSMVQVPPPYDAGTANARIEVCITGYTMHSVSPWLPANFTPVNTFCAVAPVESAGNAK